MRSDLEHRHRCRNICFTTVAVLLFITVLIVLLIFTVFKPKNPVITIHSVALAHLKFSLDLTKLQVLFNSTLDVDLSVKNPNKVGFKYTDSAADLNYRGQKIGEAPIPASEIYAEGTAPMDLYVTIMVDRFVSDSRFFADVSSGELPLNTFAEISGKVNVLNLFKIHVVSSASCDVVVSVLPNSPNIPRISF